MGRGLLEPRGRRRVAGPVPAVHVPVQRDGSERDTRRRRRSRSARPLEVVLWTVVVGASAVLVALAARTPTPPATHALWLTGSSLAVATPDAPRTAMRELGWGGRVRVLAGSGYTRAGEDGLTLVAAARAERRLSSYDVVVVQGGEADNNATPRQVEVAVQHLVDYLRSQTRARLVLVGPVPAELPAPAGQRRASAALAAAAATRGVPYVDPVARSWTDRDSGLGAELAHALGQALG